MIAVGFPEFGSGVAFTALVFDAGYAQFTSGLYVVRGWRDVADDSSRGCGLDNLRTNEIFVDFLAACLPLEAMIQVLWIALCHLIRIVFAVIPEGFVKHGGGIAFTALQFPFGWGAAICGLR